MKHQSRRCLRLHDYVHIANPPIRNFIPSCLAVFRCVTECIRACLQHVFESVAVVLSGLFPNARSRHERYTIRVSSYAACIRERTNETARSFRCPTYGAYPFPILHIIPGMKKLTRVATATPNQPVPVSIRNPPLAPVPSCGDHQSAWSGIRLILRCGVNVEMACL